MKIRISPLKMAVSLFMILCFSALASAAPSVVVWNHDGYGATGLPRSANAAGWSATRNLSSGSVSTSDTTCYVGAYYSSGAYNFYRCFEYFNLTGFASNHKIKTASLHIKSSDLSPSNILTKVAVLKGQQSMTLATTDVIKTSPQIKDSNGYASNNLEPKFGNITWDDGNAWNNITLSSDAIAYIQSFMTDATSVPNLSKFVVLQWNDSWDTWLADHPTIDDLGVFASANAASNKPVLNLTWITDAETLSLNAPTNFSIGALGYRTFEFNATGLTNVRMHKYRITISTKDDGATAYAGYINNDSAVRIRQLLNYDDFDWVAWNITINTTTGKYVTQLTNLTTGTSVMVLSAESSNMTNVIVPNQTHQFKITANSADAAAGYYFQYWNDLGLNGILTGTWAQGAANTILLKTNHTSGGWFAYLWHFDSALGVYAESYHNVTSMAGWGLDNCSLYGNKSMLIKFLNEVNFSLMNTTIAEMTINYTDDFGNPYNYSTQMGGNSSFYICISNNLTTYLTNTYIRYRPLGVTDAFYHRFYLFKQPINGTLKTFELFNINPTADYAELRLTLRNELNYQYFQNVHTKLLKYYPALGVWRSVQEGLSSSYGLVGFDIQEYSQDYRLRYYDLDNNLLEETSTISFACDPDLTGKGVCIVEQKVSPYIIAVALKNVTITYNYTNRTQNVWVMWNDPQSVTQAVRMVVVQDVPARAKIICNETKSGAMGVMNCSLAGYTGSVWLYARASASPFEDVISALIHIWERKIRDIIGNNEANWFSFLILLTLNGLGIMGGVIGILAANGIGLFLLYSLDWVSGLTIGLILGLMIGGILIALRLRR